MDKTMKIYLGALLGIILLVVIIDMSRTKPTNWDPTYSLDNKNPLDLYVFNHEVENIISKNRLKRVTVTPYEYFIENSNEASYLIINQNIYNQIDSVILSKVQDGSTLWLSAENYIHFLTDTLGLEYSDVDPGSVLERINNIKLSLTMKKWETNSVDLHPVLNSFAFVDLDTNTTTILGKSRMPDGHSYPNFVSIRYGKGTIYLHTQPQVFTNVALLDSSSSADYVAHILSYLPHDKPVIWFVQNQTRNTDTPVNETALSVIFRYPALRMTWLLFIYGMLLYLLFNAKRRQRIVPVIKPLKNTSVEFVQTIGNLYFQEGSPKDIVDKKILFFLDKIRHRYYLDTSKLDENFALRLCNKSGKKRELIDSILSFINEFSRKRFAIETDLIRLNDLIEEFWEETDENKN